MMTNISWDDWERRQESWRRETDKTEAWREGGIDRFCLEGLEREDLDGGKETVVPKRYEEEREQTEGKESERLQEGCAALGWGPFISSKHICVCSCQKDVVYESRCRCLYVYLAVQRGGRCDSDGVSQCLGAGGSRTDLVSIPFLETRRIILCSGEMIKCYLFQTSRRHDLIWRLGVKMLCVRTSKRTAVSLCVGVTDQLWVLCGCLWTRLHRMATSQEHKWNCWAFEPD